jgi:hypothetical protein
MFQGRGLTRSVRRWWGGGGGPKRWYPSAAEALRWSPAEEKRLVRLTAHWGFLKNKERERGERVTGASKSIKNSRGCTVHHNGERFESVWLTTSGWGRCSLKAEGGWCAFVWLLGEGREVARRAAVGSSTRRQWWTGTWTA